MTEKTVLLKDPESFDVKLIQEERAEANREAEMERPGLVMFTDGSQLEEAAARYAVVWRNSQTWKDIKIHMSNNQETFDTKCAALVRVLDSASRRNTTPECITIFTDVQVAIWRMATNEPGPGQKNALEARRHITTQ